MHYTPPFPKSPYFYAIFYSKLNQRTKSSPLRYHNTTECTSNTTSSDSTLLCLVSYVPALMSIQNLPSGRTVQIIRYRPSIYFWPTAYTAAGHFHFISPKNHNRYGRSFSDELELSIYVTFPTHPHRLFVMLHSHLSQYL